MEGVALDLDALERLKTKFLVAFPEFEPGGFETDTGDYWEVERRYKQSLINKTAAAIQSSVQGKATDLGARILDILELPEANFLGWRMDKRLQDVRSANSELIEEAVGNLLIGRLAPAEASAAFVQKVWPAYSTGLESNLPYRDMRTIPTTVLALANPQEAMAVRYQPIHTVGMRLLRRSLLKNAPFSQSEYEDVIALGKAIATVMRTKWGWKPRDLWDVQSFIWVTCNEPNQRSDEPIQLTPSLSEMAGQHMPTNLILYGPPGTGKTYATAEEAVRLCDGSDVPVNRKSVMARYNELREAGRIAFVTFHQSYSYEDFVEGLRPDTSSDEDNEEASSGGFRLKPVPGVFKRIAELARQSGPATQTSADVDLKGRQIFKMSLGNAYNQTEIYEGAVAGNYIALGWADDIDWSATEYENANAILTRWQQADPTVTSTGGRVNQIYSFRSRMKEGDIIIISDGNALFRAVAEVTGPYQYVPDESSFHHRRKVRWLRVFEKSLPVDTIYDGNFTMAAVYQINPSRLKQAALVNLLRGPAESIQDHNVQEPYVIIIDEINRANISKVLGELITLIEPDKRLGAENALTTTLPYSKENFGVPGNLHVIGTMNTADRSIALLDTALRRRFEFRELMPRPDLLQTVDGVNLPSVLAGLNERIEYLFDREHQIGHAYFMGCKTRDQIDEVMRSKVIPLLAEYFYEDWEKVCQVLGETEPQGNFIVRSKLVSPNLGGDDGSGNDRWRYSVRKPFTPDAYSSFGR